MTKKKLKVLKQALKDEKESKSQMEKDMQAQKGEIEKLKGQIKEKDDNKSEWLHDIIT